MTLTYEKCGTQEEVRKHIQLKSDEELVDEFIKLDEPLEDDPAQEVDRDNFNAAQENEHRYDEQNND
jgi:hypothetical protein